VISRLRDRTDLLLFPPNVPFALLRIVLLFAVAILMLLGTLAVEAAHAARGHEFTTTIGPQCTTAELRTGVSA
jgi:hypothetical protein